jgi:hypothetical protein
MDSIADNPWPWFAYGLGAFLFAAWWFRRTGTNGALLGAVAALLLAVAPLAIALAWDTPAKQVGRALESLRAGLERRDADAVLAGVSEHFRAGNLDRKGFEAMLRRELGNFTPSFVKLANVATKNSGDRATAAFDANAGGDYRGGGMGQISVPLYRLRFELEFRREAADWKLVGAKRRSWQGDPPEEIPLDSKR